jgi:hypothetical protein
VRALSSWGFSIAETTLSPALPRKRGRERTVVAAAIKPTLIAL